MNNFNPEKHHRRSIRMPGFDYACAGGYFVTICAAEKRRIFGKIENDNVRLHPYGKIVTEEWQRSAVLRAEVQLDECIVMPNHFHAIIILTNVGACGGTPNPSQTFQAPIKNLGALINAFKGSVTRRINKDRAKRGLNPVVVWQRNYYEHIIRDENELDMIRRYIIENPLNWNTDENYVGACGGMPLSRPCNDVTKTKKGVPLHAPTKLCNN